MRRLKIFKYILVFIIISILNACNGGGDSEDQPSPAPISVEKPVVFDSIESVYVNKVIHKNISNEIYTYNLDLNKKIHDINQLPLKIDDYSVIGDGCKVSFNELNVKISSNNENICSVYYRVRNVPHDINDSKYNYGIATAVFSSYVDPYLPTISKSMEVGNTITISLKDELGSFYPDSGQLSDSIWYTEGESKINIDIAKNEIKIDAGEKSEVIQIRYGIKTLDGGIKFGIITVTVSDDSNLSPNSKNKYIEMNASSIPVDIDVSELISDDDDSVSSLQILKVDSFDNIATIINTEDVYNKVFQVNIDKAGLFDINYIITDHHGGYSSSIIRIKVNTKKYWEDIILSSGVLYTAPLEKVGADQYGLPYQSLTDYYLDGNLFNIPMFDYKSADAVCRLRGMVIPTLQQLQDLWDEKGNVQVSDKWPNDRYYWTSTDGDSFDSKYVFALNTSQVLNNQPTSNPYFLTCVLPGVLSVDVIKDNSPVTTDPLSENYDELEAVVKDVSGVGIKDSVVYLYSQDKDLMLENQIGFTDSDGSVTFKIRGKDKGEHKVYVSYYSQKLEQLLNFVLDTIVKFEVKPLSDDIDIGENLDLSSKITRASSLEETVTTKTDWKIIDGADFVSLSNNTVKGIMKGSASIEGTYFDSVEGKSFSGISIITVNDPFEIVETSLEPKSKNINLGDEYDLEFNARLNNGNLVRLYDDAEWKVDNSAIATVDATGHVIGKGIGFATFTVYPKNQPDDPSLVKIATVQVSDFIEKVELTPKGQTINVGDILPMTLTAYYKGGDVVALPVGDVQWESSSSIALIDSNGVVTGIEEGQTTINACVSTQPTLCDNSTIDVKSGLESLDITGPDTINMDYSTTTKQSIKLESVLNGTKNVSNDSLWVSSDPNIASVDNYGTVTALLNGEVEITATYKSLTAKHKVTVLPDSFRYKSVRHITGCFVAYPNNPIVQLDSTEVDVNIGVPSFSHTSKDYVCKGKGLIPPKQTYENMVLGDGLIDDTSTAATFAIDSDSVNIIEKVVISGHNSDAYDKDLKTGKRIRGFKCISSGVAHLTHYNSGKKLSIKCA
ncbi:Ig-like domain-containing protein [Photobacterium damselae subsp. damselae]